MPICDGVARNSIRAMGSTVVVAAVLGSLMTLGAGPAWAEETAVLDVLKVVDGRYEVETVVVPARTAEAAADQLEAAPDVVVASTQVVYTVDGTYDPFWDVSDPGEVSHVRDVWPRTRGTGQIVAVLDSAHEIEHPDLVGALVPGTDAIGGEGSNWHGFGVAGVIAARAENDIGSAGMAPESKIMPIRVCNTAESCPSAAIARGLLWAADHGADVINMSLAGPGYSSVTAMAVQYALGKNISVVASSGNDGLNGNPVMYPAAHSGVIAVSSTKPDGTPSDWAVHGWQADISTVGDSVLLTMPGGGYASGSGTSFSGPAVAGAVALLRSAHPGITTEQVQAALQAGAESSGWDRAWGAGRLDVPAAFAATDRVLAPPTGTPSAGTLDVSWPAVAGAADYVVRADGVVRAQVTATTARIAGLTDGNQVAVDVQPGNGERSRPALVTVGPAAPGTPVLHSASLRGTSSSATVDVVASTGGASGTRYNLVRDGISLGSLSGTLSSTPRTVSVLIGAMPVNEARWQLQAVDTLGRTSPLSNAVTTAGARPAAPGSVTGLQAQVEGGEVLLTWDDMGTAYSYAVSVGGVGVAAPRTAGAVLAAPPAGVLRTYQVAAVDAWQQAGPAATVDVHLGAVTAPGAPGAVTATPGDGSATVSWSAAPANGSPISGYTVTASPEGATATTTGATSVTVPGLTNGTPYAFTVIATNAVGTGPASAASASVTPLPAVLTGSVFESVAPARVLDTRTGTGAPKARVGPGGSVSVQVTGKAGVPATGVTAVVLNVTAVWPSMGSFVTVYPSGQARPLASNLNTSPNATVPNLVVVKVGADGKVSLYNAAGSTDLIADVAGYYTEDPGGSVFASVSPTRVLDTRTGLGVPAGRVAGGGTVSVQVTGTAGVPASGVTAVVLNVTAVWPSAAGFVTVYPAGQSRPLASNLNTSPNATVPNLVVVQVGTDGQVSLFNAAGSTDLIADIAGYYTEDSGGSVFESVAPARVLDTRTGTGAPKARVGAGGSESVQVTGRAGVPASGVTAVVLNVTAVWPSTSSFVTVYPSGEARPLASNLNTSPNATVPNLVVVKVGADGKVSLYNAAGSTDLIADVAGYYTEGSPE